MSTNHQEIVADLRAFGSARPPLPKLETRRLQPLYYLHNFRVGLASLKERYAGLLSADEAAFIECFAGLSEPTQCLLTRLVMRKGPLFRRATLHYAEVRDPDTALRELAAVGWLERDPRISASDLSRVLNAEELRLALGIRRLRRSDSKRADLRPTQLALPLQEREAPDRSMAEWHPRLAGCVVRLGVDRLVKRLEQLFFGNDYQSWAEFALADLGVKRYETVALEADARAFQCREEIDHFYRLNECRAALAAGEPASVVRELAFVPETVSGWLRSRFIQLQIRIGERLEEQGDTDLALRSYRACGAVDGLVRAIRLQVRLGQYEGAARDARLSQRFVCSEAQQEVIDRALARIKSGPGKALRKRKATEGIPVIDLELPKVRGPGRVELAVSDRLSQPDSQVVYVENSLLTSLFGLLCWEALFAPVQGAFFHPFQAAPADLYTAEFRVRRAQHLSTLLALLDTGEHEAAIWRLYRAKAGTCTNLVKWGCLRPALLRLAMQCIPAAHLRLCFERLLDDLKANSTGMPDLIQFWPAERRYRLIEVKGPADRLQDNQRRWLQFFARHAIPAAVCQVRWKPEPSTTA
jgi:hypothetical protein